MRRESLAAGRFGAVSVVSCLVLAAPALAQATKAQPDPAKLAEATSALHGTKEEDVRRGAQACVELKHVLGVELLLAELGGQGRKSNAHLPQEHYRDIVWEALVGLTDPYLRERVERELASDKRNPFLREWCAELLGEWGDADLGRAVVGALNDKEDAVVRAAARAAGKQGLEKALVPLATLARHKDPIVRANALEALARIAPEKQRDGYLKALKDKDGGVRCALLGALPSLYPDVVESASSAALADADWRPRMQAVENLAGLRSKEGVDGLVRATGDGRPVVAQRAVRELQALSRMKFRRQIEWEGWWKANRETFEFPEGKATDAAGDEPETVTSYNGIRVESDHVAFLMDRSGTMKESLKSKPGTKAVAAKTELDQVLRALTGKLTFNVYVYADEVKQLFDSAERLTPKNADKALDFVSDSAPIGAKDIWLALEAVLADPRIDTVYLLSSGEPEIGKYVHWNRVTRHLADRNRFRKVVVHTIAYSDSEWYRSQLQKIAECSGGEFKYFE